MSYPARAEGLVNMINKTVEKLGIHKNYRGITRTIRESKVFYALLLNRIEPEIEKSERLSQKSHDNFTDSDNPLNH